MTSGKKTSRSGLGSKQKRGSSGTATQYLTRNAALKRLQVSLPEFRRLCILKGIHPREPRNKAALKGSSKTYYLVKDIAFLLVEPLLETFRARRAYDKKVKKARAKRAFELAQRLQRRKPGYALDHLVRERYPTFDDALRDLDDPLSMLALFATLPAEKRLGIDPKVCAKARRLDVEFGAYVARTNSLRKVFVAVKGIYLQADIQGQQVTWIIPHRLPQLLPDDVDYRVMLTFLDFYITLVSFINFKLYHKHGWRYPPVMDSALDESAAGVEALLTDLVPSVSEPAAPPPAIDGETQMAEDESEACARVFQGMTFHFGRECHRELLTLVVQAFGGRVVVGELESLASDVRSSITHCVVDRPGAKETLSHATYVQPQWLFDSANFRVAAPTEKYAPGAKLPPHVSPFAVADEGADEGGYVPEYAEYLQRLAEAAGAAEKASAGSQAPANVAATEAEAEDLEEVRRGTVTAAKNYSKEIGEEGTADEPARKRKQPAPASSKKAAATKATDVDEDDDDDDDDDDVEEPTVAAADGMVEVDVDGVKYKLSEDDARARMLMPRKSRRLFDAMQRGIAVKQNKAKQLRERKSQTAGAGAKASKRR